MDEWLSKQQHKMTKGDDITVYILSQLYNCHTMIHTKKKPWFMVLPTGTNFNYAATCQTHLLYMGNHVYGLLHPKPLPPLQPLLSAVPANVVSFTVSSPATPLQPPAAAVDKKAAVPA